ncbi:uncharacterized protein C5L36_0A12510 [Pichia kudriavzevii]|uniref:NADH-ubiquinone oxidoreductase assembly factor N7BML n=1 Tax=Pichia kudriavzevii TaxID=4909 RepID=A0A2U9R073_PICKU|nr:uncharacterized protein C5L36_0A12510 [Pichia kudriavzevii]AWU74675.1 hypothetical protein C5L36_0A12510 [Pichia kudriavzevii]
MSMHSNKIKTLYQRIPLWKQLYYKWRSIRGVPLRKKFFVGYDLEANTYWEFYLDRQQTRPRRLVEPYKPQPLLFDYFNKLPIQWTQWLRYTRRVPPTIEEILKDEERIRNLQALSQFKEHEQTYNKHLQQEKIHQNLQKELHKLEEKEDKNRHDDAVNAARFMQKSGYDLNETIQHQEVKEKPNTKLDRDASSLAHDPWKRADTSDHPQEATMTPRR